MKPLSDLIGFSYTDSLRHPGDAGEPLTEFAFQRKVVVTEFLPDNLPPAFRCRDYSLMTNNVSASFISTGGKSEGIEVYLVAKGFDAECCTIDEIRITWKITLLKNRRVSVAKPERSDFEGGNAGWVAEFPDIEIVPGPNPERADVHSPKSFERAIGCLYKVDFTVHGENFPVDLPADVHGMPVIEGKVSYAAFTMNIIPMQNRTGHASAGPTLVMKKVEKISEVTSFTES